MFIHVPHEQLIKDISSEIINNQRWYSIPNGDKYPSVTTVLGIEEKPWLEKWKLDLGDRAIIETKRCADRGTAVHLMAERFLKNEPNVTEGQEQKHIFLFNKLSYSLKNINNIIGQELPLYSTELKVAGRCDCIAEYKGKLSIIDFKTSTNLKTKEMIKDYFLQLSAYALLYNELYNVFINQGVILIATERGLMPLELKINTEDYIIDFVKRINTFYSRFNF